MKRPWPHSFKRPEMVEFFERETSMKFVPTLYPDYHPTQQGGVDIGRSILAAPYDIRGLGKDMERLKLPLRSITFIGMMFNSSNADLKHFFRATKSLTSFLYVARRLASHLKELILYRRAIQVTSGNALAARLAKSALDLGIPILTSTPVRQLLTSGGRVTGVLASGTDGDHQLWLVMVLFLLAAAFRMTSNVLRKPILICVVVTSICRLHRRVIPAMAAIWRSKLAVLSTFVLKSPLPGCP